MDDELKNAIRAAAGQATDLTVAIALQYRRARWDGGAPLGEGAEVEEWRITVPRAWGPTVLSPGVAAWAFEDGAASFGVEPLDLEAPDLESWVAIRREKLSHFGEGWLVAGHRCLVPGTRYETLELNALRPQRPVQVRRSILADGLEIALVLQQHGQLSDARGNELATAYATIRGPSRT